MVMQARGIEREQNSVWQEGYVNTAASEGIIDAFNDYDIAIERGLMFVWSAQTISNETAYVDNEEEEISLEELLGLGDLSISSNYIASESEDTIGFTTGGGFGASYVRDMIKNETLPEEEDVKHNNFLKDYSFSKPNIKCEDTFCPITRGISLENPISGEDQNWLEIYLGSNIKKSEYTRLPTNFTLVLDVSGSMNSTIGNSVDESTLFDISKNDYCSAGEIFVVPLSRCIEEDEKDLFIEEFNWYTQEDKIEVAKKTIIDLVGKLKENDRLSIVTFENTAATKHPLIEVGKINMDTFEEHIDDLYASGGTNMEAGITHAIDTFSPEILAEDGYQNRMIFITDAMPNINNTSEEGFITLLESAAEKEIYTSFMGVGLNFNKDLVSKISNITGGNYFYIDNNYDFYKEIILDFDYNFFPMFFDIELSVEDQEKVVKNVYGMEAPEDGTFVSINTLFPSAPKVGGATKGSVMLLELSDILEKDVALTIKYSDQNGKETIKGYTVGKNIFETERVFSEAGEDINNTKKAVLIVEYVDAIKKSLTHFSGEELTKMYTLFEENSILFTDDDEFYQKDLLTIERLKKLVDKGGDFWEE